MSDIFSKLKENYEGLKEEDIEWILPEVMQHLDSKIRMYAKKAHTKYDNLAFMSFKERAKEHIKKALITFLFSLKHWESDRQLESYLLKVISTLSVSINLENKDIKPKSSLICPACKLFNIKQFLIKESKNLWICNNCTSNLSDNNIKDESKIRLYKVFAKHSGKGFKCPDCNFFIPESNNTENGISCPNPTCSFFGDVKTLITTSHPSALNYCSLNKSIEISNTQIKNNTITGSTDALLNLNEEILNNYNMLSSIIKEQSESIKNKSNSGTVLQKTLICEAYLNLLKTNTIDIVAYLVHKNKISSIQSRIFQEYVKLLEDTLPCDIIKSNKKHEIVSLLDPNLGLFDGISVFNAKVNNEGVIPNITNEHYIGGRDFKDYGPYFIGSIIDITDQNGKSLKKSIKEYTFTEILMEGIEPNTLVTVKHYRIPAHYEMGILIHMQKIREKIISKVNFKNK